MDRASILIQSSQLNILVVIRGTVISFSKHYGNVSVYLTIRGSPYFIVPNHFNIKNNI